MNKSLKGFSLIEFMVSILITIMLVGGFTFALNSITAGTRNAARSEDLTNLSRGVFKVMQADIYNASKSLSDLNMFQIHVNANNGDEYFYGLSDVGESGIDGSSFIELQWFDYHREWLDINGNSYNMPTHLSTTTWMVVDETVDPGNDPNIGIEWDHVIPNLTLMSSVDSDPGLANVESGDYFILYRADTLFDTDAYDLQNLQDNVIAATGLWNEQALQNGAMLLQVASARSTSIPVGYDCSPGFGFLSATELSFGGTTFVNNLAVAPATDYTEPTGDQRCIGTYLMTTIGKSKHIRPPDGAWMARKVGESRDDHESFKRIRYYLDTATETLIRSDDGTDMILASNVEFFDILVGMDIIDTAEAWDGSVSIEDGSHWIRSLSELGVSEDQARAMVGRHALAIKMVITFKSVREDQTDTDASGDGDSFKRRTFEQIFRLKNGHLPMGSL